MDYQVFMKPNLDALELKKLAAYLEEASSVYYNTGDKIVSDEIFDQLKTSYETLSGLSFAVGAQAPSGKRVINMKHDYPQLVGTLSKLNSDSELFEWLKTQKVDNDATLYFSRKYDGNSLVISFDEKGNVIHAMTRGRDGKGVDMTNLFSDEIINNIFNEPLGIKYEVVISYEKFNQLLQQKDLQYANPRSMTSGLLSRDDAHLYKDFFTLIPLEFALKSRMITREEQLEKMALMYAQNKQAAIFYDDAQSFKVHDRDGIRAYYQKYNLAYRSELEFMVDGLVAEILNQSERERLGRSDNFPYYAVALKFPYTEKQTRVIGIEYEMGRSGRITPMILFEPVDFYGAIQKRVAIGSYKRFSEIKLGLGSDILIQYRNEVISYIEPLFTKNNKKIKPFEFIKQCPICSAPVAITINQEDEATMAYCSNDSCDSKVVGRVIRFTEKIGLKGISYRTIETMFEQQSIANCLDLFHLEVSEIAYFGLKQSQIIIDILKQKLNEFFDYELFAGIGLNDVGLTLARRIGSLYEIKDLIQLNESDFVDQLKRVEGIAAPTALSIYADVQKHKQEMLDFFEQLGSKIITYKDTISTSATGKSFCITGSLNEYANRNAMVEALTRLGHRFVDSVTSKTDYLINNDKSSPSKKNQKAKALNIPILSEQEFIESFIKNNKPQTNIDSPKSTINMDEKKYKVSITGKLNIFVNREAMSKALNAQGHTFVDSVSSKTEILVNNDNNSPSAKNKTAKAYNIPIMTEEEAIVFLKLEVLKE